MKPDNRKRMDENSKLRFKNILSKPNYFIGLATLVFLPLLFIGTHTSHDWGDNFAQYIHQAGNIVHGIPQSETGYIYNQLNYIGPQAYPVGFPLMLTPVYALTGNNMVAFTTFLSLIYIILGLLMATFYHKYFSPITALVLAIIFLYNPQMLLFKREIMSDIPFTALLVLNIILYQKLKPGNLRLLSILVLLTGFMLTVRPAGIVFVMAVAMEQLVLLTRRKTGIKDIAIRTGMFTTIPILIYLTVNSFLFKVPSGGSIRDYMLFFNSGNLLQIIPENFSHHIEVFRYLYIPEAGVLRGFSLLLGSVMLTMTMIGFVKRLLQGPDVIDWFFIFYVLMLLVFPNNDSAYRLMVPLGFISLFYAATGLKAVQLFAVIPAWKKAATISIIILILFIPGIFSIVRSQNNIIEGPQKASSVETFNFIRKNVPAEAVVVFAKPRALALYAGCQSMADPFTNDPTQIHLQIAKANATYLLIHDNLTNETTKRYSRVMQNRLTKLWGNKEFVLYKINPVNP